MDFYEHQAEVVFALEDSKEVGFARFFLSFSTYIANVNVHLEDLFVDPEYRGKGYGKGLLKELAGIIVERGYGSLNRLVFHGISLQLSFIYLLVQR